MKTVIVELRAKSGRGPDLAVALGAALAGTIDEPDCYKAELFTDDDDPDQLVMVQQWSKSDSHRDYAATMMSDPKLAAAVALMARPPKARYTSTHTKGGGAHGGPQHLELASNDMDASKELLASVFDWRFAPLMEGYEGFWAPGAFMGGIRPVAPHESGPGSYLFLVVDDLDARFEKVNEAGAQILIPITEIPHVGRFFWFVDPGGLTLAVWEAGGS